MGSIVIDSRYLQCEGIDTHISLGYATACIPLNSDVETNRQLLLEAVRDCQSRLRPFALSPEIAAFTSTEATSLPDNHLIHQVLEQLDIGYAKVLEFIDQPGAVLPLPLPCPLTDWPLDGQIGVVLFGRRGSESRNSA